MKKVTFKLPVLALLCSTIIVSCKKDSIAPETTKSNTNNSTIAYRTASLREYQGDILALLSDNSDAYDKKVQHARYAFANAFRQFVTPEITEFIYDQCNASESQSIQLSVIFAEFPDLEDDIDDYLANNPIPNTTYTFNSVAGIESQLTLNNESGRLEINIPNLSTSSATSGKPVISFGQELEDEVNHDDQYFAWDTDVSIGLPHTAVSIDEAEGRGLEDPILNVEVTYPSDRPGSTLTNLTLGVTSSQPWLGGDAHIGIKRIRVYKRYERWGKSEVCYSAKFYNLASASAGGSTWADSYPYGHDGPWATGKKIVECTSSEAGGSGAWKTVDMSFQKFVPWLSPSHSFVLWNTFERDWIEGLKVIAEGKINGKEVSVWGNVQSSSDTYMYPKASTTDYWMVNENRSNDIWNAAGSPVFATGNFQSEMEFYKK